MMNKTEPNYTLTITEADAKVFIVCEGGEPISKPFTDRDEAEWWLNEHRKWDQPQCCVCGSAISREDDPWEAYSVSCSSGADYMHKSCMQKFHHWTDTEAATGGPMPPMEVLDAAWAKRARR
jgi:hypothetical protein